MPSQINKKGQITIFIIIGIVLLLTVGLMSYLARTEKIAFEKSAELTSELLSVKDYVENCVSNVATPGVYLLASNGGYIYDYEKVLLTEFEQIAVHLEIENDTSPKKEFMEKELSRFIRNSLPLCIEDFKTFGQFTLEYAYETIDTKPVIRESDILIKTTFPIKIKQENSETTIAEFAAILPIRLGRITELKDELLQKLNQSRIDLQALSSYDVRITGLPYDKNYIVYSIFDNQFSKNQAPFIFNFAVKSEFNENNPPIVQEIAAQKAFVGQQFYLKIITSDPDGDKLTFSDETSLFDINANSGEILFTPTIPELGNYEITITVTDGLNNVKRALKLKIEK